MKYTLNGSTINLSKDIITEESLNTMIKEIDSSYNSCSKAIETYNLVSNVKAIESFGYKATEGLGESIKNGAKAVWEKIKEFFKRISLFTNKLITDFIVKINFPFEKDKTEYVTDTNRKRFLDASKFLYNASVKILKKISSPDIYNNTEAIKAYQKLEIYTGKLTKILRNGISIVAKADRYLKKLLKLYSENMNKYQSKIDQFQDAWNNNISNFFISTCNECGILYQYCDLETYGDLFDRVSHQDKLDNLLEQSKNIVEKFTLKIVDIDSSDDEQKRKIVNDNSYNGFEVSKNLKKAVEEKNIVAIRDGLWSRITLDPNFTEGFPKSLEYCLNNGISESELYEIHDNRPISDEVSLENFSKLCGQLRTNFSKERLEKIKEIGRKLYPIK